MTTRMFPIGCGATLRQLEENPHPLLARLRVTEPVSLCAISSSDKPSLLTEAARAPRGLSQDEVVSNAAVLMFGGVDTTEGMSSTRFRACWTIQRHSRSSVTMRICCRIRSRSRSAVSCSANHQRCTCAGLGSSH
jgi:hypothetical protein